MSVMRIMVERLRFTKSLYLRAWMDVGGKQEQLSSPLSGHSTHGRSGKRVCAGQGTPIWLYSHLYDIPCSVFTPIWHLRFCIHTYMTPHVLYSHLYDTPCAVFTPIWRLMCCIHTYMTPHVLYSHLYDKVRGCNTVGSKYIITGWNDGDGLNASLSHYFHLTSRLNASLSHYFHLTSRLNASLWHYFHLTSTTQIMAYHQIKLQYHQCWGRYYVLLCTYSHVLLHNGSLSFQRYFILSTALSGARRDWLRVRLQRTLQNRRVVASGESHRTGSQWPLDWWMDGWMDT